MTQARKSPAMSRQEQLNCEIEEWARQHPGLIVDAGYTLDIVGVWIFDIIAERQGSGLGSQFLLWLGKEADRLGVAVKLSAAGDERLVRWYERHGFVREGLPEPGNGTLMTRRPIETA